MPYILADLNCVSARRYIAASLPVLSMRFCDTVRWRVTASDDDVNPNVYYLSIPVKPYLQDMDTMLKTIENGIKSDGVQ